MEGGTEAGRRERRGGRYSKSAEGVRRRSGEPVGARGGPGTRVREAAALTDGAVKGHWELLREEEKGQLCPEGRAKTVIVQHSRGSEELTKGNLRVAPSTR